MKNNIKRILGLLLVIVMLGAMLPASVFASDYDATVSLASADCCPGDTVEVSVELKNNPGVVSVLLKVEYDKDYLTLTDVVDGGILGESMHSDNYDADLYTLSWANDTAAENITANGTIATLTFAVSEDAPEGKIDIAIDKTECLDYYGNVVDFNTTKGSVNVYHYLVGDANGDGIVDTKDRIYLSRHLAGWLGFEEIDERAADVNGNSELNTQDRMYISRHLAGWIGYEKLVYPGFGDKPGYSGAEKYVTVDLFDLDMIPGKGAAYQGSYTYYDENDRLVTVSAHKTVSGKNVGPDVYINGINLADIRNINDFDTVSELCRMSGTITFALLDSKNTTADYDTVYIDASVPFVVDKVNEITSVVDGKKIGTLNRIVYLEEDSKYEATLYGTDGAEMDWAELEENDVLMLKYIETVNGTFIYEATFVDNKVEGKVVSLAGVVGAPTRRVRIGDTYYNIAGDIEMNVSTIRVGDEGVFYLDANGRIVYFDLASSVSRNYGYVIDTAAPTAGNFLSGYQMQILTKDNKIEVFDLADKIRYNANNGLEVVGDAYGDSAVGIKEIGYSSISGLIDTVITYNVNSDNEISAIFTAACKSTIDDEDLDKTFTYDDTFWGDLTDFNPYDNSFGRYTVGEDTIMFLVENSGTAKDRKNAEVVALPVLGEGDRLSNATLYDVDADDYINCILIHGTGSVIGGQSENATFVVGVEESMDEEGNTVYIVTGYKNGTAVTYTVDDAYILNGGTYNINFYVGKLVVPEFEVNGKIKGFKHTGNVTADGKKHFATVNLGTTGKIDGNKLFVREPSSDWDGDGIIEENEAVYLQAAKIQAGANVYVFDSRKAATGRGFYQINADSYLNWDFNDGIYYGTSAVEKNLHVTATIFYTDTTNAADVLYFIN